MKTKRKTILPLVCYVVIFIAFAGVLVPCQAQLSDSLYNALPQNIRPADKTHLTTREKQHILTTGLIDMPRYYTELGIISASLIKEASLTSDIDLKINDLNAVAVYYSLFSHDSAILYCKKILSVIKNNKKFYASAEDAYFFISEMYFYSDKYDSAINELHTALDISMPLKDTTAIIRAYGIYGVIYARLLQYKRSAFYERQLLQLYSVKQRWGVPYVKSVLNLASRYNNLYGESKNPIYQDSALSLINMVMQHEKSNAANWYQACYYALGYLDYENKNYIHAIVMFDSSLLPVYNKSSLFGSNYFYREYLYKAVCLIKLGHYAEGQKMLKNLKIGQGNYASKQVAYLALSEAAEAVGNNNEAFYYYKKFKLASDSLNIQGQQGSVFESEQNYQAAKKEASIALLENKNLQQKIDNSRILVTAVIIVLFLGVVSLLLYQRTRRNQYQRELALANQRKTISANMHDEVNSNLAALRFLISDLKEHASNSETKSILTDLEEEASGVYAHSRNFMHQIVGQDDEKEAADIIALLQKLNLRFNQNSTLQINIDVNEMDVKKHFTQQQHIEMGRVIKEAVANTMKYSGASKMYITIQRHKGRFWFEIKDNGHWIGGEDTTKGIGLTAIYSRIGALKGHLNLTNGDGGTTISGSFPLHSNWWLSRFGWPYV